MSMNIDTRVIHTIRITVTDDVLGKLEMNDEVEVILCSRTGETTPKKLTYRDVSRLLEPDFPYAGKMVKTSARKL